MQRVNDGRFSGARFAREKVDIPDVDQLLTIEYVNDWVFICDGKVSPIAYGSEVEKECYRL